MLRLARLSVWITTAVYIALLGGLYGCQNMLLFRIPAVPVAFANMPEFEHVRINTPDHETLDGWYAQPAPGKPLVLMFHGNKGREPGHPTLVNHIHSAGYGFLLAAFRGYPPSTGQPSQEGLYTDGLALFDYARAKCACDVVVLGHSLGSGVAVHTAALREVRAVLLVSPYSSVVDVASYRYWFAPVRTLVKNEFPSMQWIGKVTEPLIILHGQEDVTIPIRFAEKLFAAANEPKQFKAFSGVGHHLLWEEDLVPWLDALLKMHPPALR